MRINQARADDEAPRVDGARSTDSRFSGITNEDDTVGADADISGTSRGSGAVDELTVADQNVKGLLGRCMTYKNGSKERYSHTGLTAEQPRYQGKHNTDQDAGDNRKVEPAASAANADITRQAAQADAKPLTHNDEQTGAYQHCACANQ
jgi:hypothetical protein